MNGQITADDLQIKDLVAQISDPAVLEHLANVCTIRARQIGPTLDRLDLAASHRHRIEGAVEALGWVAGLCEARFLQIQATSQAVEQG